MQLITAALDGEPQHYDWIHKRQDGSLFDAHVSLTRIDADGTALLLVIIRDITKRIQAERELQESEHRFRTLIEYTSDAVFCYEFDPPISTDLPVDEQVRLMYKSRLIECNDVCARSYGASTADEVVGKELVELFGAASGSLDRLFRAVVEGGYRIVDGEQHQAVLIGYSGLWSKAATGLSMGKEKKYSKMVPDVTS
jgi:PAS domain-containing protein